MTIPTKSPFILVLGVTATLVAGCRASSVPSQEALYSPREIHDWISTGVAQPHGAQFENQGMGCKTFLWRISDNRRIFVFTRDGESYGEYREELLSNAKFLRVEEMYLDRSVRNTASFKTSKQFLFVRKVTTFHYEGGTWAGSTMHWELLQRTTSGSVEKYLKQDIDWTSKASVTMVVPSDLMATSKEYYLGAYSRSLTEFEKAFYGRVDEKNRRQLHWGRVVNGKCEMSLVWPTKRPGIVFELHERIPNPPLDPMRFMLRTKSILSMARTTGLAHGENITFEPSND